MANTKQKSNQAQRALNEANKRHSDKMSNYEKMPKEKKGAEGLNPPDTVIGK